MRNSLLQVAWNCVGMEANSHSALSPHALKRLKTIAVADIVVGIPSFNNAHTINYVVYQAAKGLETYFPDLRSVIFISDGGSSDGTLETVEAMHIPSKAAILPTTYAGTPGKGSAVKAVFEAARFLQSKAVALVDSDLRSITPQWIKLLLSPTLKRTGLVTPFYVRHKYDGTITNFLCYPITSCLYGKKVRQPIGGDFGLSIELAEKLLDSPLWENPYVPRFGIDIFETHTALAKDFSVKQAFLRAKVHDAKDPSKHLAPMFRQVLGSMFTCIDEYKSSWKNVRGIDEVEIVDKEPHKGTVETIKVDVRSLVRTFREGVKEKRRIYRRILSDELLRKVDRLGEGNEEAFAFPAEVWAKTVYSFAAGFRQWPCPQTESLLDALRILWIGKIAAFVSETWELNTLEAESKIEEQLKTFEENKPYLLSIYDM
jgi:glycosyltransferase involved in cell wall biosynthesis